MLNVKNKNKNNNLSMFNMKNRNKNNIMIRQSMALITFNVIHPILNLVHPLINPINTCIQSSHTFLDVLYPSPNLG